MTCDDLVREFQLPSLVLHSQQCTSVSSRDVPLLDHLSYRRWQRKHAKQVRDGGSILTNGIRDLLLCELELLDQALISLGLFQRIEIRPLQILNESKRKHRSVVEIANDGWNLGPAQSSRCAEASFARYKLPSPRR